MSSLQCGPFVAQTRRRRGLSQQQLAERARMTQTNISRIERDKVSPSIHTLNRLLEAMGETLVVGSVPLAGAPPGGGNSSIRELREDFDQLTPEQRIEQAASLSRLASELGAGRSKP